MGAKRWTIFLCLLVTTAFVSGGPESSEENMDYASEKEPPAPLTNDDVLANITVVLGRLEASIKSNEKQIQDLKTNILADNARLSSSIDNLAAALKENRKLSEEKFVSLAQNIASEHSRLSTLLEHLANTVANDRKIQEGTFASLRENIAAGNSQLSGAFKSLAGIVQNNQQNMETKIVNHAENIFNISQLINNLMNSENGSEYNMTDDKSIDFKLNIAVDNSNLVSSIDDLTNTVRDNQKITNEKIASQSASIDRLHDELKQNQKAVEDEMASLRSNISLVVNATRDLLKGHVTEPVEEKKAEEKEEDLCRAPKIPNLTIVCEMESFDGRWIVIQQRVSKELNFTRGWQEYRDGFGVVAKDESFWLGNEAIHQITSSGPHELVIEMKNEDDEYDFARYAEFSVGAEDDKYRLKVGGHSGNVPDHFSKSNNMKFTTYDQDNDHLGDMNCADMYGSGWWFNGFCGSGDLNHKKGVFWSRFAYYGSYSRMMIRRK